MRKSQPTTPLAAGSKASTLRSPLLPYRYSWPSGPLSPQWQSSSNDLFIERVLPESDEQLASDSRWPAFFPSSITFATSRYGDSVVLEKVVGASIVNRFPYIIALSFCTVDLSKRHHSRRHFIETLEQSKCVAVQLLPPGRLLDSAMQAILGTDEAASGDRLALTGLPLRNAASNDSPVFDDAYMVYEGRLVKPTIDFEGNAILPKPFLDMGSHRIYFFEIEAIQLRRDIADGQSQIHWTSLPDWTADPGLSSGFETAHSTGASGDRYQKGYNPHYSFPSENTVSFECDEFANGMAIKYLSPLPKDQVEVDNDRARWPCFFPQSAGLITSWAENGMPNMMPCGSTTVVSRSPFIIAPCVSYGRINERYAPRNSLDIIRRTKRFSCAVPFLDEQMVDAIRYTGNVSFATDNDKLKNSMLTVSREFGSPVLPSSPINFDCEVVHEELLGTHSMFFGEVKRILMRKDVSSANPLFWCPFPDVDPLR